MRYGDSEDCRFHCACVEATGGGPEIIMGGVPKWSQKEKFVTYEPRREVISVRRRSAFLISRQPYRAFAFMAIWMLAEPWHEFHL